MAQLGEKVQQEIVDNGIDNGTTVVQNSNLG